MRKRVAADVALLLCLIVSLAGCTLTQRGAAVGAGAGAIAGAIIGSTTADAGEGALIGAGGGALIGALVGDGMDQCRTDKEIANLNDQIAVLTEENEALKKAPKPTQYVIQGKVLFATGSAKLTDQGKEALNGMATKIRAEYPGKPLWIEGNTDDVPIDVSGWKSNWELGSARALAVLHYLADTQKFPPELLAATTYGKYKPEQPNDSAAHRQQNRRADLVITVR